MTRITALLWFRWSFHSRREEDYHRSFDSIDYSLANSNSMNWSHSDSTRLKKNFSVVCSFVSNLDQQCAILSTTIRSPKSEPMNVNRSNLHRRLLLHFVRDERDLRRFPTDDCEYIRYSTKSRDECDECSGRRNRGDVSRNLIYLCVGEWRWSVVRDLAYSMREHWSPYQKYDQRYSKQSP